MTSNDLPFQHSSLKESGTKRKKRTLESVKGALHQLNQEQSHVPEELRAFETKDIIRIVNQRGKRRKRIHRSTLNSNVEAAAAIANARGEFFQATPDFSLYASKKITRSLDRRAQSKRRSYLIARKSRDELAQDVIGLTELDMYYMDRRKLLEKGKLEEGPWPKNLPFPNAPFVPSPTAGYRYQQLRTRESKVVLARTIVALEKRIVENRQHIHKLDSLYLAQKPKQKTERKKRAVKKDDA